ncbi:alanine:cation symporter family protein [Pedobacter sp. SD-b]|uniref:Alanine:cation symporter family protein n=1 Tax=Pedobacter segetis TaxID=2793069 RepID=A0ABS1BPQ0_9SPHI|nr:alanine/glycine:cation symporter family protein [Pedobacter segetis]MBK0384339.1 alanine:cation symporter family protein [Pedobacter segetis]
MKLKLLKAFLLSVAFFSISNSCFAIGIDEKINKGFAPIADAWETLVFTSIPITDKLSIPIVLIVLIGGALFFTLYFSFVNIRKFPMAIKVVQGKYDFVEGNSAKSKKTHPDDEAPLPISEDERRDGEVSHFQALTAAVSGTVGLGNIAGVAVAIAVGGPGATFWMVLAGLLGMSSKFVECTLGVKYRDVDKDGTIHGGPMYYLSKGLKELKMATAGKTLAVVFAILCVGASFGGGNAFQSNQAVAQLTSTFGLEGGFIKTLLGLAIAAIVAIVILGGIKRIAVWTERIVPFMAGLYVIACLIIIFAHINYIGHAFGLIFSEAFSPAAGMGGFLGVLITGFRRAAFSNEAGVGSASIAHSAVKTRYPASEGVVSLLEPFIDTVVICTMTALVIIFYNMDGLFTYGLTDAAGNITIQATGQSVGGVDLTTLAFDAVIPHFSYVLTIAIVLFAFSTMLSWSYYGLQAWKYLFGRSKSSDITYKILFLIFVIIGAAATLDSVVKFSDAMILAMVFPNMIGLIILSPKVKSEMNRYMLAIKKRFD